MSKTAEKTSSKQWGSFEQWKDDIFPKASDSNSEKSLNFNSLIERIAAQSFDEARREMNA